MPWEQRKLYAPHKTEKQPSGERDLDRNQKQVGSRGRAHPEAALRRSAGSVRREAKPARRPEEHSRRGRMANAGAPGC